MDLAERRNRIDDIDAQIVRLLCERALTAIEIGKLKSDAAVPIYAPVRERHVLDNVRRHSAGGPLKWEAVERIYIEVISACRALEDRPVIAHYGATASFTHMAAVANFGGECRFIPCDDIHDVFNAVEKGHAQCGVVPIENTTGGVVPATVDRFVESPLSILSERYMGISHYLSSKGSLAEIGQVYSHPQVFAQCQRWLRENLPEAERVEVSSSSKGAERAAAEGPGSAAIGTRLAADMHGLTILAERIEDYALNRTRFWVIGHGGNPPSGKDKTSVVLTTRHEAGALYQSLAAFERSGINLTMIQSRPSKGASWEYIFFIDFQGHKDDERIAAALEDLRRCSLFCRVLGSYPEEE